MVVFYRGSLAMIWDTLRFTFPLLLIWLAYRVLSFRSRVKQLKIHQKISTSDPVQAALVESLKLLTQSSNEQRRELTDRQQEQFDHVELYSHEIKNSLMELQAASENNTSVDNLTVQRAVRKANYHLDMLLNDERLAMLSTDYVFEWVDVAALVQAVLQDNAALFINRQLTPDINGLSGVEVLTDRKWLRFCINQLLSNAIKYTPRGRQIKIRWEKDTLSISNPGEGIAPVDLNRVFENGFSGRNGHQSTKSTGMGLYLVKKTADQLNFQVYLNSVLNKSTTASLVFSPTNIQQN